MFWFVVFVFRFSQEGCGERGGPPFHLVVRFRTMSFVFMSGFSSRLVFLRVEALRTQRSNV